MCQPAIYAIMMISLFRRKRRKRRDDDDFFVKDEREVKQRGFLSDCPLCGSSDYTPMFDDYVKCSVCGYMYHQRRYDEIERDEEAKGTVEEKKEFEITKVKTEVSAGEEKCPRCGSLTHKELVGDMVECEDCSLIFKRGKILDTGIEKRVENFCPKCGSNRLEVYMPGKVKCLECGFRFAPL